MKYKNFDYQGIKYIEIPKNDVDFMGEDYGLSIIEKYLPSIMNAHKKNCEKIEYFYEYYLGKQDILEKTRLYKKDEENNNIVVENHARRQVDFNVGFITGEERDYTLKADTQSDDLIYLNRYFTDCSFFSKDKELKMWVFATGVGAMYTSPKTDIIVTDGIDEITKIPKTRYKNASEGFDINFNAPFNFNCVDPRYNFVVYSSGFNRTPLFCVSIVDVDVSTKDDKSPIIRKQIQIETRYASFIALSDHKFKTFYPIDGKKLELQTIKALHYIPMIEYSANSPRIGIVETNRDIFNQINILKSNILDMVVDNANIIFVFKNTDVTADQVLAMKRAGAMVLNDTANAGQNVKSDLSTITVEIPFEGLTKYYEQLIIPAYDISGTPLASGQISSGGSTGQAIMTGAGWDNAYIISKENIATFKKYDYEQLKLMLMFCKQVPNCPLNELNANQIEIKYRINQNDNFLAKAQGIMNLYNVNFPKEEILKASGLVSDVTSVDRKWKTEDAQVKEKYGNTSEELL